MKNQIKITLLQMQSDNNYKLNGLINGGTFFLAKDREGFSVNGFGIKESDKAIIIKFAKKYI